MPFDIFRITPPPQDDHLTFIKGQVYGYFGFIFSFYILNIYIESKNVGNINLICRNRLSRVRKLYIMTKIE